MDRFYAAATIICAALMATALLIFTDQTLRAVAACGSC